jgi:2-oxoglutarate dehydrogenase E2 component (dihydrolipoamide succinyltransferase)
MLSLKVPPLGESIVEATVSRWVKQVGDAVAAGDTIVELDTDKITVEVPALRAGVLAKQTVAEGAAVKVDDVLGEVDDTASTGAASAPAAKPASAAAPAPASPTTSMPATPATGAAKSSPAARRLADEKGVDIAAVSGTGRGGVVSKPDVIAASSAPATPASSPAAPAKPTTPVPTQTIVTSGTRETREKMTTRRKRIADNLLNSHLATAHLTTFNEIDMSAVIALRERVKEKTEKQYGVKLSFIPFFVKAACLALKDFPIVNAQIEGDEIVYKNYVNIGIAVASEQGLIVPNIKDADQKGLLEISNDIGTLAKRARDSKLSMDDLTGGTFTITNGGVFGSLVSTPIINYPQVGILGLHKTQDRPVAINGNVEIRPMMYIALSYDHRIIDGQQAVLFVVRIKELMEDPATMLIT